MLRPTIFGLAILFSSALGTAQMSGIYTIDPGGSGSRNFPNFASASQQLFMQGINAAVEIQVAPGNYTESWVLTNIVGAFGANTVTFISPTPLAAKVTKASQTYFVSMHPINLAPVTHVVFDGFEMHDANTAIVATSNCNNIEIRNCLFKSTSVRSEDWTNALGGMNPSFGWNIHHNRFEKTGSSSICVQIDAVRGVDIHHNEFILETGHTAISMVNTLFNTDRSRIYNNLIQGQLVNSRALNLISAWNVDLDHNTILVKTNSEAVGMGGAFAMPGEMRNNLIANLTGPCLEIYAPEPFSFYADYNLYWSPNAPYIIQDRSAGYINHINLASWQAASGQGTNSLEADPLFVNDSLPPFDLSLIANSPARGAGDNLHTWVVDDFLDDLRKTPPTIGALEFPGQASFSTFGAGCAGNGGQVPVLGFSGSLSIGSLDFAITLSNANGGLSSKAFFAAGVSNTMIGGTPLPFDFGGGCSLLQSNEFNLLMTVGGLPGPANGSTNLVLGIPNDPNILGQDIHFQWGVVDPAAAGIGIAFSNGGTVGL